MRVFRQGLQALPWESLLVRKMPVHDSNHHEETTMATSAAARKTPTASTKATPVRAPAKAKRQKDACDLLDADHKAVKALFKDYESLAESRSRSTSKKRQLADQICKELTVHATIEEEIFYPAVRKAIKDNDLMNEATVEHASAKDLIAQIKGMEASDDLFDAKVTVLGEYIDHHVKEERTEMFTKARASKLDLVGLAAQLKQRKDELMAQEEHKVAKPVAELAAAY
jgi:hemerythrin superfamily protein